MAENEQKVEAKSSDSHGSKVSVIAAILGNIGVAIVKFIASAVSQSSAMFSEAIHSLVDCGNGILILFGMKRAKQEPDFTHPFGFGKELYFYTLIVALLIFLLGGGVAFYDGIRAVQSALTGDAVIGDPLVNYVVIIAAAIIEGSSLTVAIKNFNRARKKMDMRPLEFIRYAKDPSLYTVVLEDTAAETGLVFALAGTILTQVTRNAIFDGIASCLIGLLLFTVSFILLKETKGLLVGEGITSEEVNEMRELVFGDHRVLGVGRILTQYMGPHYLLVDMDVTLLQHLTTAEVDEVTDGIERRIKARWPEAAQIFIEVETLQNVVAQQQDQAEWDEED